MINAEDLDRLIPYRAGLGQPFFKLRTRFAEHRSNEFIKPAVALGPDGSHIVIGSTRDGSVRSRTTPKLVVP